MKPYKFFAPFFLLRTCSYRKCSGYRRHQQTHSSSRRPWSKVDRKGTGSYTFQADDIDIDFLNSPEFAKKESALRGSIKIVGPLLARFEKAISQNRVAIRSEDEDWTHTLGFQKLGAKFSYDDATHFYKGGSRSIERLLYAA